MVYFFCVVFILLCCLKNIQQKIWCDLVKSRYFSHENWIPRFGVGREGGNDCWLRCTIAGNGGVLTFFSPPPHSHPFPPASSRLIRFPRASIFNFFNRYHRFSWELSVFSFYHLIFFQSLTLIISHRSIRNWQKSTFFESSRAVSISVIFMWSAAEF